MATYDSRKRRYIVRRRCQRRIELLAKDLQNLDKKDLNLVLGFHKKLENGMRNSHLNNMAGWLFEILGNGLGDLQALKDEIKALKSDPYAREPAKIDMVTPELVRNIPLEREFRCPQCRKAGVPLKCDGHWYCIHLDQLNPGNPKVSIHHIGTIIPVDCWDFVVNVGREIFTCYDMSKTHRFYIVPKMNEKT